MTPKEQEIAIGELEDRVDRLRNIYEQYFLGFEKLEPTVPRKDVDRRFALLRKEQIRNTAMRFRFNVIWQKYNTYSMHWIRICRQIEEGTYKRHIRKAKARFGDVTRPAERDIEIDIDMAEFDSVDMDDVLAEANAAAESYERDAPDTVPPPASSPQMPTRVGAPRQMVIATPGTSFAIGGPASSRREVLDEMDPRTPPPAMTGIRAAPDHRAARPAALPPGAKGRIQLRRRGDEEPPQSQRAMPVAPPVAESAPQMAAARPAPAGRPPPQSNPSFATGAGSPRPAGPRIAPAAAPSQPQQQAAPSAGRLPIPPPSNPGARPAASAGRLPAAAPLPAPSAGRLPIGAPPPAQGSRPNIAPIARGPGPQTRGPMPTISDKEDDKDDKDTIPPPPQSSPGRPRAPLPLPSQLTRPKK